MVRLGHVHGRKGKEAPGGAGGEGAKSRRSSGCARGDSVPLENAVFSVLAPSEPASDKDNNNSLVMMLESADGRVLLAGDMELPEEEILLGSGADLSCDV